MLHEIAKKPCEEEDGLNGMEVVAGNEDLLTEIVFRLPVRSLLRFKSVSKLWLSLISSPQFCVLKSNRCCKHISGILLNPRSMEDTLRFGFVPLDHDCPAPFERLDFLDGVDEWNLECLQYCNGLLLCKIESKKTMHYVFYPFSKLKEPVPETKYYVINPTTKQHTTVPFPVKKSFDKGLVVFSVGLAFDPRKSLHFKLICLFWYGGDYLAADFCVQIYSSETGLMTQCSDSFRTSCKFLLYPRIYWNGAINWISNRSDGFYLNVDEERFGILPMSPAPQDRYGTYCRQMDYYGESYDHLYLVQSVTSPSTQMDVYEMDREYFGWFVRFHVDLQPMFRAFPTINHEYCMPNDFSVLAIVDKDDDENSSIVFSLPGTAIRFHLKDGTFTRICDFSYLDSCGSPPMH